MATPESFTGSDVVEAIRQLGDRLECVEELLEQVVSQQWKILKAAGVEPDSMIIEFGIPMRSAPSVCVTTEAQ